MNEPRNDSPNGCIAGAVERAAPSLLPAGAAGPATTVVMLVGVRLAAQVLNPVFFAVVLSLLFGPVYAWLGRRGIPRPVALVVMLFGMTLLFVAIFDVLGTSIARFSAGIGAY